MKGYGLANLEWQQPVTPDTAFPLTSSTKPFTGIALMLLVEEGKLGLDDKISKYATRLGPPPKGYANWTLRFLARKVVELEIVERVSYETVRRTLKKTG